MQHRFSTSTIAVLTGALLGLAVTAPAVTSANASDSLTTASAASFAATFDSAGTYPFTVPSGVNQIKVEACGGGTRILGDSRFDRQGGSVSALLKVKPGQTLQVNVAGGTTFDKANPLPTGGFNGGGSGSSTPQSVSPGGAGATDIRTGAYGQADRVIVAGGAGGSSVNGSGPASPGGSGGSPNGKAGDGPAEYSGKGATSNKPGDGAFSDHLPTRGSLGTGGTGVPNSYTSRTVGGGGGGGQYGGGGGFGSGAAGGGSSFADPTSTAAVKYGTSALQSVDGRVTISLPMSIRTNALPVSEPRAAYAAKLNADGGSGEYVWSLSGRELPPGLSLDRRTGAIAGATSTAGVFSFTAQVADATDSTVTASKSFKLRVWGGIDQESLPAAELGKPYSTTLTATGGFDSNSWTVTAGKLPAGLTLEPDTGRISGVATGDGTATTIEVIDTVSKRVASKTLTIDVFSSELAIEGPETYAIIADQFVRIPLAVRGGVGPYTWSVKGNLPRGIRLTQDGQLHGTTTASPYRYRFILTVTDATGATASANKSIICTR